MDESRQAVSQIAGRDVVGPDTPARGERNNNVPAVTESQIAATVAAFLGEDYSAAVPKSGEVIGDVVGK